MHNRVKQDLGIYLHVTFIRNSITILLIQTSSLTNLQGHDRGATLLDRAKAEVVEKVYLKVTKVRVFLSLF